MPIPKAALPAMDLISVLSAAATKTLLSAAIVPSMCASVVLSITFTTTAPATDKVADAAPATAVDTIVSLLSAVTATLFLAATLVPAPILASVALVTTEISAPGPIPAAPTTATPPTPK